ncbi:hypothetical protein HAX54_048846 [Datura stramonium]|uniref:Uncharacterized protein n=1 Tax=Datura stramonium TaxID=4076 RepID=A0ABS8SUU7_DATST|nr:hypothetical protein [Datura stramonium]
MAKWVDKTRVIEVGSAQAYLCYGLRAAQATPAQQEAWRDKAYGATGSTRHHSFQPARSQIPVLLGTEAAKPNFNSRRNNEGLIYYYKYPLLTFLEKYHPAYGQEFLLQEEHHGEVD